MWKDLPGVMVHRSAGHDAQLTIPPFQPVEGEGTGQFGQLFQPGLDHRMSLSRPQAGGDQFVGIALQGRCGSAVVVPPFPQFHG